MKHALLRTLPGRAIVIGLAVKLVAFLSRLRFGEEPAQPGFYAERSGRVRIVEPSPMDRAG